MKTRKYQTRINKYRTIPKNYKLKQEKAKHSQKKKNNKILITQYKFGILKLIKYHALINKN